MLGFLYMLTLPGHRPAVLSGVGLRFAFANLPNGCRIVGNWGFPQLTRPGAVVGRSAIADRLAMRGRSESGSGNGT
jgi:hypothetical protein